MTKIGETISGEQFNKQYGVGQTISADEFNKKYGTATIETPSSPSETPYQQRTDIQRERLSAEQYKPLIAAEYANTPIEKLREVGKTFVNLPSSAFSMAKGAVSALVHPIATLRGLSGIVVGAVQKAIPGQQAQEKYVNAIGQAFRDRYGGAQIQLNAVNDPMGFGSDLFTIISGGAKILGKTAELEKLVSTVAKPATIVSTTVNRNIGKGIGKVTSGLAGLATSKSPTIYQKINQGSKDTIKALRGNVNVEDVSDDITRGIAQMKSKRNSDLNNYLSSPEFKNKQVSSKSILEASNKWLKDNGVMISEKGAIAPNTALVSDTRELDSISRVANTIDNWTDWSTAGTDTLKQAIRNIDSGGSQSNRYITEMANVAKNAVAKVAGQKYLDAEADYSNLTKSLKDITTSLSAAPNVRAETTINTLTNLLKGNKDFKIKALNELSEYVGKDLLGELSGIAARPMGSSMTKTLTGFGTLGVATKFITPQTLFLLAATSPRMVANFAHVLGLTKSQASLLFKKINEITGSAAFNVAMNAANKLYEAKQQQ